jgi:hypothetical protein|tara:strand:+ start:286 stop:492 length:207 start_codon:yes stop_codon:yes gene_type:complete
MTLDKFKRVLWRLEEMPNNNGEYNNKQIRLAIMEEIGTDERTIRRTITKMRELKLLTAAGWGNMTIKK